MAVLRGLRTQLGEEGGVLLAQGREDVLREGERRVGVATAYELNQPLLLQVERQLRMLLQYLQRSRQSAASGTSCTTPGSCNALPMAS